MFYEDEYLKVDTIDNELIGNKTNIVHWDKTDVSYMTEKSCIRISNKLKEINFPRKVIITIDDDSEKRLFHGFVPKHKENNNIYLFNNSNRKDTKIPLTPWIVLHRCIHAIQTATLNNSHNNYFWENNLYGLGRNRSGNIYNWLGLMLTSKSRNSIANSLDFEAEIVTQYLYNGKYEIDLIVSDYQEKLNKCLYENVLTFQYSNKQKKHTRRYQEAKEIYEFFINPKNELLIRESLDIRVNKAIEILNSDVELAF